MKKISIFMILIGFILSLSAADYMDFINEGLILLKQGKPADSIRAFERAKGIQPSSPYPYYYLGEAYYAMGKKKEALDNYNKAIEIDKNNPDFHYALAHLYISEGSYEEAVKSLDEVIKIAPSSITGRLAKKLKESLQVKREEKETVQKWVRLEEEKKKQEAEKTKTSETQAQGPGGMMPPEFKGQEGQRPPEFAGLSPEAQKEEKIPVEKLIKSIKFGTEKIRYQYSSILPNYEQAELLKVVPDMISIVKESKETPVRKNVILALGKTETPEGIDTILKIIQDKNELFDIKISAIDSISKLRKEDITTVLRNTLKAMVDKRESDRTEAQKNIKDITAKLENLEAQRIALNMQVNQDEQKKNEIMQKLGGGEIPGSFALPPGIQQGIPGSLDIKEIQKLRAEMQKFEASLEKKKKDLASTEKQIAELQQQKGRYEALLKKTEQKMTDVSVTGPATQQPQFGPMGPEFGPPAMETPKYEETAEDKNEVIFALKLIRTLGSMKDKQALPVIKKAWDEYGVDNERIYYILSLARLGDFSGINTLVERLGQDYPQDRIAEEIGLRKGIIEVLGDYLAQRPDQKLLGLIEYLSEEGPYPEIKGVASSVLASLTKAPGK
jgi:tetratricopeptide (TPR) repeat protein